MCGGFFQQDVGVDELVGEFFGADLEVVTGSLCLCAVVAVVGYVYGAQCVMLGSHGRSPVKVVCSSGQFSCGSVPFLVVSVEGKTGG